jgi:hypothetical protein
MGSRGSNVNRFWCDVSEVGYDKQVSDFIGVRGKLGRDRHIAKVAGERVNPIWEVAQCRE